MYFKKYFAHLFYLIGLAFTAPAFLQINEFFYIFTKELVVAGPTRTFLEAQMQQESASLIKGYICVRSTIDDSIIDLPTPSHIASHASRNHIYGRSQPVLYLK